MSSPSDEPDKLPDPRELFEQLEEQERQSSLPDPAELFRQMEAEEQAEEQQRQEAEELGVFGTFEGLDSEPIEFPEEDLSLDLPMPASAAPLIEPTSDQTVGLDFISEAAGKTDKSLPDPAELFRQMQEQSQPELTESEDSLPFIPAPTDAPLKSEPDEDEEEGSGGLFQRLKDRFRKSISSEDDLLDEDTETEAEAEVAETSLPTPEELFRQMQEENESEYSDPSDPSDPSTLPTPEELFRQMQEEETAAAVANGTELPQLPDLEEFKRQLEEEERARLDPDVLTDLSGPERFVPTVSDNIFSGQDDDVLPGFRSQFPVPPEPEPEPEPPPEPTPKLEKVSEPAKDASDDDFFSRSDWGEFDEPVEAEPVSEDETDESSPTGTVRVQYQSSADEMPDEEFVSKAEPTFDPDVDRPLRKAVAPARAEKPTQAKKKKQTEPPPKRFSRYKLAIFTRQMSVMLKAGIQLHSAIAFAAEADPVMRPLLETILQRVESGYSFSRAIVSVSRSFDPVYVGLISAGEQSGRLPGMLERLADVLEKEVEMRKRLISTITYPAMLLLVCLLGTLGFLFFVLPTLEPLFADLGVELPLPTRILLMSRDLILPGLAVTVLTAILAFLTRDRITDYIRARPILERRLAAIPFQLPVVGDVYEKIVTSRVLYSLSVMLDVGITLNQALAMSENTAGNALTAYRLGKARMDLADGVGVTDCFRLNDLFSPSALHLISAGEEAAKLADMFQYVARLFDEEVEFALEGASSIMEPLIMVVMGMIVGFITISAALPTIQLLQNFS